ncbi:MAG: peptidoglycan synthetase, partial [Raineya sp.]|nr:peptidoglycan synthetase [Raineya sp.]
AVVYFNPKVVEHKKLAPITAEDIKTAFEIPHLQVFDDSQKLADFLKSQNLANSCLLLMSSGNFDNLPLKEIAEQIAH